MKRKALLTIPVLTLALAAVPAVAQMKIIAIQAKVGGQTFGVAPNSDSIPVDAGSRVRVDLVGTSIEGGRGVERPVNARFDPVGRGQVDILQVGPNWAVVSVRGGGAAQLGYHVAGNYDMRGNLHDGVINFAVNGGGRGGPVIQGANPGYRGNGRRGGEYRQRALDIATRLYGSILNQDASGPRADQDIQRIFDQGYAGVREVALHLAHEADRSFGRIPRDQAVQVVGDLYRGLLGRDMGDRQLWEQDNGFRNNVQELREHGYVRVVQGIVDSEEFRSMNDMDHFGGRAGYRYDRSTRDRYHDWRPPGR